MKKIEAVKPTTSNGSHVETSSNISRSSRIAPQHNAKVPSSFPGLGRRRRLGGVGRHTECLVFRLFP